MKKNGTRKSKNKEPQGNRSRDRGRVVTRATDTQPPKPADAPSTALATTQENHAEAKDDLDIATLAREVLDLEAKLKQGFAFIMWRIADMIGNGLERWDGDVTHYKSKMAAALGRSESYVDKYLRLSKVPDEKRALVAEHHATFTGIWHFLFPSSQRSRRSSEGEKNSGAAAGEAAGAGNERCSLATTESEPTIEPGPLASEVEPAVAASVVSADADLLAALDASTVPEALTRITEFRQREQVAKADVEALRKKIAELEKQRDMVLAGGPIGKLLRLLGVKTISDALVAVEELKANAAA